MYNVRHAFESIGVVSESPIAAGKINNKTLEVKGKRNKNKYSKIRSKNLTLMNKAFNTFS